MNQRLLFMCGMVAPWWFVFITILGVAIRLEYSYLANTISELIAPNSPNKPFLYVLHTIFAVLLILIGIGLLLFFQGAKRFRRIGLVGATLFILMGCVSVTIATIFPQDPWGTTVTVTGEMHQLLSGAVGLQSLFSILLIGIWFIRTDSSPRFGVYSFVTIG